MGTMRSFLLVLAICLVVAQARRGGGGRGRRGGKKCVPSEGTEGEAVCPTCNCSDEDETPADFTKKPCPEGSRPDKDSCECPDGEPPGKGKKRGPPTCSDDSTPTCQCDDEAATEVDFTNLPCPEGSRVDKSSC